MDDTSKIIDALRMRFPQVHGPRKDDICYATQNRQDAVKDLASRCDVLLVVGSRNSSNSNRLRELAESRGTPSYLIDGLRISSRSGSKARRSEEHTSELQSLMRISYAVFCLKKKTTIQNDTDSSRSKNTEMTSQ